MHKLLVIKIVFFSILITSTKSIAQVIPDNTLHTVVDSVKTTTGTLSNISGGTLKGQNLFHSLQILNINKGDEVDLLNPNSVNRIFIRVTGGNSTIIDGMLNSSSNSSVYLINQSGLLISKNAIFNIGGPLILTTASKFGFSDGSAFSSLGETNEFASLSSEEPNFLFFDGKSGNISILGNGHTIIQNTLYPAIPFTANITQQNSIVANSSITIAGNNIELNGGVISNGTDNINLFSINKGNIYLNNLNNKILFSENTNFANISLENYSLIYTKGNGTGSINLFGNNINLQNRSLIIAGNYGFTNGGDIILNASGTLSLSESDNTFNRSLIWSENASDNTGSSIHIDANNIELKNSVGIASLNYGNGVGGSVFVNSKENLVGTSNNRISPAFINPFITSTNLNKGKSGDTIISSKNISLSDNSTIGNFCYGIGACGDVNVHSDFIGFYDGGLIDSVTFGPGNSGSINIDANTMYIYGFRKIDFSNSGVITSSFSSGHAGNININTNYLTILDGGVLSASALSSGNGGDISVNAKQEIVISGITQGSRNPTQIAAFSSFLDPVTANYYNLYAAPSGKAGNISINTDSLKVLNGARITVQSDGLGKGGALSIKANKTLLDNGNINAFTTQTDGGNVSVTSITTVLKSDSTISASAGGSGNGGNVTLNTKAFAADQTSKVLAQAIKGHGGNIDVSTLGIEGKPTIDASSEIGISGIVTVRGEVLKRTDTLSKATKTDISTLNPKCIPGSKSGRIIGVTDDFLTDEVLDNLESRPEQLKFVDDLDGGKIKPLLPERGYVTRSDGKIEFVYVVPADVILSSKLYKNACNLLDSTGQSTFNRLK